MEANKENFSLEWISSLNWDSMINLALFKIITEDDLNITRLRMRIRSLQSVISDAIETHDKHEKTFIDKVKEKEEELSKKYTTREDKNIKEIELEYFKLDVLIRILRRRIPVKSASILATVEELNKITRDKYKERLKELKEQNPHDKDLKRIPQNI